MLLKSGKEIAKANMIKNWLHKWAMWFNKWEYLGSILDKKTFGFVGASWPEQTDRTFCLCVFVLTRLYCSGEQTVFYFMWEGANGKILVSCLHAGKSYNRIVQYNSHRVIYFVYISWRKIMGGGGLMERYLKEVNNK